LKYLLLQHGPFVQFIFIHVYRTDYHPHHITSQLTTALALSNSMRKFSPAQHDLAAATTTLQNNTAQQHCTTTLHNNTGQQQSA
jgi:hypothetical protein